MPNELKPEPGADFAADFRDGETMAREWIAGRGDLGICCTSCATCPAAASWAASKPAS
jgi:hypothetical protein